MKKILSFIITFSLFLSIPLSSYAESKSDKDDSWETRRNYIEKNIIELGSQGDEKVDEWLLKNGFEKSEEIIGIQPLSSPGSVQLYSIEGYYDSQSRKYLVKGWWTWNSIIYPDGTSGAVDGVSLALCQTNFSPATGYILSSNPAGIAVYDQDGTYYSNAAGASKIDNSGIAYTFQDTWNGIEYVGYKGQVWFWMDKKPNELPLYIKMDFEHTWSSANLSSFGINWEYGKPPTLIMNFSITPSNFIIANQVTLYSWPSY